MERFYFVLFYDFTSYLICNIYVYIYKWFIYIVLSYIIRVNGLCIVW